MLVPPATPPSPTPAPTPSLASAYGAVLEPRQTNYFNYYSDCNYNNALKCTSIVSNCYDDMLYASDYRSASSCFCTYGISYLDCFFSNFATGSCASYFGVTGNWGDYQMSYYTSYCGSIPPSVMAQMQVPTSVSLDFDKVQVVTTTGALQPPKYDGKPDYEGQGDLLKGDCAKTGFTQVDAGNTVYYAGFVGCIKDRPECCPYTVNTAPSGAAATETAEAAQDKAGFDFPQPVSSGQFLMARCASDYYSISGGCCPNGYWPFTTAVGGQTPCWSSIDPVTAPKLTIEKGATTKEKPTSAVVNIVWSMRYPVADSSSSGLSTAAKAGIGAGAGIAAILIAGLAFCLWRSRRKNKKLKEAQAGGTAPPVMTVPPTQQQPQTTQPPAEFKGAYLVPSPSTRTSVVTTATPATLIPQNTGTSNGGLSDLSSQNGYFAGAAANNPRLSYSSSNGAVSPPVGQQQGGYPYPAAIAEADEGQYQQQQQQQQQYPPQQQQQQYQQYQYPQQYGYPPQQGQPPQQQYYNPAQGQGQGQGQGQYYQQPQGGYGYPPTQQQQYPQQQQGWNGGQGNANVPEMSAHREADPPQEVMGSNVPEVRGS